MQTFGKHPSHGDETRNIGIAHHNMGTRNRLLLVQAPHVQFMHAQHPGNTLQVVLDVVEAETARHRLQQDGARAVGERNGRDEDHNRYAHADGGVGVEARRRLGAPDDGGGGDDGHVVEGVAQDVQENAHGAEIRAEGARRRLCVHVGGVRMHGIRVFRVDLDATCTAVGVGVGVAMLVEKDGTDEVQGKADAAGE